jgi:hypothetical protein
MSERLPINDSWVLERTGHFSSSFSSFISDITGGVSLSAEIREGISEALKLSTPEGQKELGIPAFISPLVTKLTSSLGPELITKIQSKIDSSLKEADAKLQKQLQDAKQKQQKALAQMRETQREKLTELDQRLKELDVRLNEMGKTMGQHVASNLFGTNLDTLAQALYDVVKERGITNEGVLNLIRMLPEFEALMYFMNVRKFYRDHTAHSLRVAVLGDYIIEKSGASGNLVGIIQDKLGFTAEEAHTAWWLAGLLHDIGIPLAKLVSSINWSLVNEILRCYPSIGMEISPLRFDIGNPQLGNEAYLKILSKGMPKTWQELIHTGLGGRQLKNEVFVYTAGTEKPPLYQPQISKIDHGVVAAVTLLRTLGPPEQVENESAEARPLIEAARAIALHNFVSELNQIPFEEYPLLFVLALADELQEWGRPIPVTLQEGFFTTTIEKITLLDAIFHDTSSELWDIPYTHNHAKDLVKFDFKRLYNDKKNALACLDCTEQYPDSDLWLINYNEEKSSILNRYQIKISTQ